MLRDGKIIVISGPTAGGKSYLAVELAKKINGVVLNADSMQIYEGLPILSAQPNAEDYSVVEHKLYGILPPHDSNSVFRWLELVVNSINKTFESGKIPIVVGGTGMYISRFVDGIRELPSTDEKLRSRLNEMYKNIGWNGFYEMVKKIDEESILKLKMNDKQRLIRIFEIYEISGVRMSEWEKLPNKTYFGGKDILHINISPDREILYKRCELRFEIIFKTCIEEVKNFTTNYGNIFGKKYPILNTIGLLEVKDYIEGKTDRNETLYRGIKKTKNYAKRQYTWFRNQFKNLDFLLKEIPNRDNINSIINNIIK
ncbi:MAG: tRNA (adenosine(37)-N6)-dimethylallyltransferase MiaA [Rickettsiales bacterium]|jgi:tRNA dimethylallyltransferase|nr:tRNA (adenosine(37)-N6)-dimethylallyltransferase MiaA [Rickettsiales bacterium]